MQPCDKQNNKNNSFSHKCKALRNKNTIPECWFTCCLEAKLLYILESYKIIMPIALYPAKAWNVFT